MLYYVMFKFATTTSIARGTYIREDKDKSKSSL